MTQALTTRNDGTEIIPIDPTDAKAWEPVNTVLGWMSENACYNYSKAFRQLDVAPASFYRAVKRPYVQGKIAARMEAVDKAVFRMIEEYWPAIMANMTRIAQGGGREAVQAARFIESVKQDVQEKIEDQGTEEGEHPAKILLDNFRRKRTTFRRVTVFDILKGTHQAEL